MFDGLVGVGWILPIDVTCCMICSDSFSGFFASKKINCRACGIVICTKCSCDSVSIFELGNFPIDIPSKHVIHAKLADCGPQVVCSQCYWGQEVVYCTEAAHIKLKQIANASVTNFMNMNENLPEPDSPATAPISTPLKTITVSWIIVTPHRGHVLKFKRVTNSSKVFVNICHSESLPSLNSFAFISGTINNPMLPMVLGGKKPCVDKSGNESDVYDVVINSADYAAVDRTLVCHIFTLSSFH